MHSLTAAAFTNGRQAVGAGSRCLVFACAAVSIYCQPLEKINSTCASRAAAPFHLQPFPTASTISNWDIEIREGNCIGHQH